MTYFEIDWSDVIAGFLVAQLPFLIYVVRNAVLVVRSPRWHRYRGTSYVYHWSGTRSELREKRIKVSLDWKFQLQMKMTSMPDGESIWRGRLIKGGGANCYMLLQGQRHSREHVLIVVYDELGRKLQRTSGVLCGVNVHGSPFSSQIILSRDPLSLAEAAAAIGAERKLVITQ